MYIDRRNFLKLSALGAAAFTGNIAAEPRNGIPYRTLGRTGEEVSLLGIGGYHIGVNRLSDQESIGMIRHALDEGVNFLDNAWDYTNGRSETRMGQALKDGYRDKAFLMTKVLDRSKEGVKKQLEESLTRLDVDVIDLWQFHSLKDEADARQVCEELLPLAVQAREEGKVRYIGFTGHVTPASHVEMLKCGFEWDSVQMPLSIFDYHWHSFQKQVIPPAQEQNVGVIAMKTLTGGARPHNEDVLDVKDMWRYSMSLPVSTVVTGLDSREVLDEALEMVRNFKPLEESEKNDMLAHVREVGESGRFETYKRA